jgi:biopolymer transport protein ExbD
MITRPLELAARLRPPPRNLDALFLVNGALLGLFFVVFGSRFVLAPGLGVDFRLPTLAGAVDGAAATMVVISLPRSDMVLVEDSRLNYAQLRGWLEKRGAREKGLALLVRADRRVPLEDMGKIAEMAGRAGFTGGVQWAMEPAAPGAADAQP